MQFDSECVSLFREKKKQEIFAHLTTGLRSPRRENIKQALLLVPSRERRSGRPLLCPAPNPAHPLHVCTTSTIPTRRTSPPTPPSTPPPPSRDHSILILAVHHLESSSHLPVRVSVCSVAAISYLHYQPPPPPYVCAQCVCMCACAPLLVTCVALQLWFLSLFITFLPFLFLSFVPLFFPRFLGFCLLFFFVPGFCHLFSLSTLSGGVARSRPNAPPAAVTPRPPPVRKQTRSSCWLRG